MLSNNLYPTINEHIKRITNKLGNSCSLFGPWDTKLIDHFNVQRNKN